MNEGFWTWFAAYNGGVIEKVTPRTVTIRKDGRKMVYRTHEDGEPRDLNGYGEPMTRKRALRRAQNA
jgi:hypothetical protein